MYNTISVEQYARKFKKRRQ